MLRCLYYLILITLVTPTHPVGPQAFAGVHVYKTPLEKLHPEPADSEPVFQSLDFDESKAIGAAILIQTDLGQALVERLKRSLKEENNTSARVEQKSVLPEELFSQILQKLRTGDPQLKVPPIDLKRRDLPSKEGMLNGTFTIYGRAVSFKNWGNIKTKIRIRIRTYLDIAPDYTDIQRTEKMRDKVFLEIKIKNPTYEERNGSNKYRLLLTDRDILKLLRADPEASDFGKILDELKESALALGNKEAQVEAILEVIQTLASLKEDTSPKNKGGDFIKPQYATAYARESYAFVEKGYPFQVKVEPKVKWYQLVRRIKKRLGRLPEETEIQPLDVEYQLTVDENVIGLIPEIHPDDTSLNIEKYFNGGYSGPIAEYSEGTRTVEIKLPAKIENLRPKQRSTTHQFLQKELIDRMKDKKNIVKGFDFNRGKSGHISEAFHLKLEGKSRR